MIAGLIIFVTAFAASLFWLWLGGYNYSKDTTDIVDLDEDDKQHIQ